MVPAVPPKSAVSALPVVSDHACKVPVDGPLCQRSVKGERLHAPVPPVPSDVLFASQYNVAAVAGRRTVESQNISPALVASNRAARWLARRAGDRREVRSFMGSRTKTQRAKGCPEKNEEGALTAIRARALHNESILWSRRTLQCKVLS